MSKKMIITKPDIAECIKKNIGVHRKLSASCKNHKPTNLRSRQSRSLPSDRPIHIYNILHAIGKTKFGGVTLGLLSNGYHSTSESL